MASLYWDCFSGIAGNMAVASLLDCGVNKQKVIDAVKSLPFEEGPVELIIEERVNHGIKGMYFNTKEDDTLVHTHKHHNTDKNKHEHTHSHTHAHSHNDNTHKHEHTHTHAPHRGLKEIFKIIESAQISDNAKKIAKNCFNVLAQAESKIHNKSVDEIHFHEVGARDSITDIICIAVCLDDLNITKVYNSTVSVGYGTVNCAHGIMPIPAPATALLLKDTPINANPQEPFELTTPTGAAILKGLNSFYGMPENFVYSKVGHGMGSKEIGRANFLRAFVSDDSLDKKKH